MRSSLLPPLHNCDTLRMYTLSQVLVALRMADLIEVHTPAHYRHWIVVVVVVITTATTATTIITHHLPQVRRGAPARAASFRLRASTCLLLLLLNLPSLIGSWCPPPPPVPSSTYLM